MKHYKKKCLIVVNTSKTESRDLALKVKEFLLSADVAVSLFNFDGSYNDSPFLGFNFVVTLGGDGTVLFAARCCVRYNIPIFPINLGEFGFIASIDKNTWQAELTKFLAGSLPCYERTMLNVALVSSKYNNEFSGVGLNDVVLSTGNATRTISFSVFYNDIPLGDFKADGVIISTPTGSTAYSASAGGPIIDSDVNALLLTPINSFSLSSRPLVLSAKGEIGIKMLSSRESSMIITIDGQRPFVIQEGDLIKIRQLKQRVRLVSCSQKKFYEALRSKLNWSGGPHAI